MQTPLRDKNTLMNLQQCCMNFSDRIPKNRAHGKCQLMPQTKEGCNILFKKKRGIHIPYNKQGLIYFTCMNVADMPEDIQQKISNLCIDIGKEHNKALYELLTNDRKTVLSISLEHYIDQNKLCDMRKKFYESW